ncbi:hypothetical protein BHE74_00000882 [Ensete ventricosum]|nr:hypothetical protein BHE74_00000882 [Ensete ventricosum]
MWDLQIPAFTQHFRVLRFDTRGHGKSLVTEGPYSIEQLGRDVIALLDALDIPRAHFCGLSMGGLIGQWLGINAGSRLHRLVVCNTAAKIGTPEVWNPRIEMVLRDGAAAMTALRDASIARWFTADFAEAHPHQAKLITDMLAVTSPEGYAANCGAVRDADFREQLSPMCKAPNTPSSMRRTCPMSKRVLRSATVLSNFCWPPEDFFVDEKQRYAEGLQVRREVLGDAHVDRSLNALTEFNSEFQEMITRHAWGDIWTRPGLPRHTRSLITIAMLIGMNRSEELKLHLRAAASNGVTRAEIKEVLMQSAIYCGIPAANATFHLAESVWDELGVESRQTD